MNKYTKLALATATGALLLLAASSTLAGPSLLKQTSDGATIFIINTITPGGKYFKGTSMSTFVANTGDCSNLHKQSYVLQQPDIPNEEGNMSSENISNSVGKALTCFKWDIVVKGKTYSTGAIALDWDGAEYTAAHPNFVTLDFTK